MNDDFIGIYDGALTPEECAHILQRFEASDKHMRGRTGMIEARQGRLIIAPAGFTHTHKGHVAASGDKYVATSWILYRRAEDLFK
jgi:hypothetical protein